MDSRIKFVDFKKYVDFVYLSTLGFLEFFSVKTCRFCLGLLDRLISLTG